METRLGSYSLRASASRCFAAGASVQSRHCTDAGSFRQPLHEVQQEHYHDCTALTRMRRTAPSLAHPRTRTSCAAHLQYSPARSPPLQSPHPRTSVSLPQRFVASSSPADASTVSREARIRKLITDVLTPNELHVEDVSGGCGSFFKIAVSSKAFAGKTKVAQHRLVNELLKDELKSMHGITLSTFVPKDAEQKI